MKQILVLGGNGFIGKPLVQALRKKGNQVVAPSRDELDIENEPKKLAELVWRHDILVLLTQPCKRCIENIVSALALCHPTHVLYASTVLLYGSSTKPQREEFVPEPQNDYARLKLMDEDKLRESGVPLTIARLGNVYGGSKNKGIVQKALRALYQDELLTVSGEKQLRDFVHIEDVVRSLVALIELTPAPLRIVNVSTGKGVRIGEMLELLERIVGKKLRRCDTPSGPMHNVVGDNSHLKKIVGFKPKISLVEGLKKTIINYEQTIRE